MKVSLHGDRFHHDRMVGRPAFEETAHNLQRLLRAGVTASVQTTVVAEALWAVDWMVEFCVRSGVKRLTVLPFLPRGAGLVRRNDFQLSTRQRSMLHSQIKQKRRSLGIQLDLRWVDMTASPLYVVEVDGKIMLERGSEVADRVICTIDPHIGLSTSSIKVVVAR